jgi:hypothetical protein
MTPLRAARRQQPVMARGPRGSTGRARKLFGTFNVVVAALAYCLWRSGRLFILIWLPCAMESATRFALEQALAAGILAEWLRSPDFEPATFLSAFLVTPWAAMAWSLVLRALAQENSGPPARVARERPPGFLGLCFSRAIFAAAAIFSAVNLVEGFLRFAERQVVLVTDPAMSDAAFAAFGGVTVVVHALIMAVVIAVAYPLAGIVLRSGTLYLPGFRWFIRGKILRFAAIFFILTIVLAALDQLLRPAELMFAGFIAVSPSWVESVLRYVIDFPLSMLMIIAWAVTVGIMLRGGAEAAPAKGRDHSLRRATSSI